MNTSLEIPSAYILAVVVPGIQMGFVEFGATNMGRPRSQLLFPALLVLAIYRQT